MAVRMDRIQKRLVLLHVALILVLLLVLVVRVPLAVPSVVSVTLLVITTVVGIIAFVILPLYNWVNLKAKNEVPIRYRAYEVVSNCFLLITPVFLLRNYIILPTSLDLLLTTTFVTTLGVYLLMRVFSSYFQKTSS